MCVWGGDPKICSIYSKISFKYIRSRSSEIPFLIIVFCLKFEGKVKSEFSNFEIWFCVLIISDAEERNPNGWYLFLTQYRNSPFHILSIYFWIYTRERIGSNLIWNFHTAKWGYFATLIEIFFFNFFVAHIKLDCSDLYKVNLPLIKYGHHFILQWNDILKNILHNCPQS